MDHILIIDNDYDTCDLLSKFLKKKGYATSTAHTGEDALKVLKGKTVNTVLCAFRLPDTDGMTLLKQSKILQPTAGFIITTSYADVKIAVKAIKQGAFEYITKPLHPEEILHIIREAIAQSEEKTHKQPSSSPPLPRTQSKRYIHGKSRAAQEVLRHVELVAPTNMTVVIQGETGTGKEYLARTIHQKSKRKEAPFVAVDCGVLTNELAGSELFGHEKGAFTGAAQSKSGSFEIAHKGTLFLDEIGNLSHDVQVKLLRALQERKIIKIGGVEAHPVDVRILAASNERLKNAVQKGAFRKDLFHRLNEFSITMPALRERPEDIMHFARFFLSQANESLGKSITAFSEKTIHLLKAYPWYGNLRELRNVIRRAVLLTEGELIRTSVLPHEIIFHENKRRGSQTLSFSVNDLKTSTENAEVSAILKALQQAGNNKSEAARLLNIDRKTLYNKLRDYEITF